MMQNEKKPEVLFTTVNLNDPKRLVMLIAKGDESKPGRIVEWLNDLAYADGPDGTSRATISDWRWDDPNRCGRASTECTIFDNGKGTVTRLGIDIPGVVSYIQVTGLDAKQILAMTEAYLLTAKDSTWFLNTLQTVVPCEVTRFQFRNDSLEGWV